MKITKEADYALRIIEYLCIQGKDNRQGAKNIAFERKIPARFTLKILRKLVKCGIVHSYRGINGGYAIAKNPEDISMYDVISAIDGEIEINKCTAENPELCENNPDGNCPIKNELLRVQQNIKNEMAMIKFSDLIEDNKGEL